MRSEHPRTPWLGVCHRVLCACGSGSAGSVCPEFRQPGRKTWVLTNLQSLQNEVKTFRETEETSGSGSQQNAFLELFPIGKHSSVLIVVTSLVSTALD